jgi:TRAP-type C4-dicarboxylate transport system permease small subunit
MGAVFSRTNSVTIWMSGAAVALMMAHVCLDVIGKYLFNAPVPGTIAIVTEYYMPVLTFLPLAYVHHLRAHISVEVLTKSFPRRLQFHLYHFALAFSSLVFALLAWSTFQEGVTKYELGKFQIEGGLRIATWPGQFLPPVGYGLIALLTAWQVWLYLRGRADPNEPDGEIITGPEVKE